VAGVEDREAVLHACHGRHPLRSPKLVDRHVRNADLADLSGDLQIAECANAVLDRHGRVGPVQRVQIDDIDIECAKARLAVLTKRAGTRVLREFLPVSVVLVSRLRCGAISGLARHRHGAALVSRT
jgi:hypothetical protein